MLNRQMAAAFAGIMLLCPVAGVSADSEAFEAAVARVGGDIRYFASDELEGRGIETHGIELAAERITSEFARLGVKPGMPDGSYLQPFDVRIGDVVVAPETHVRLTHAGNQSIVLNRPNDYQPMRRGTNGMAAAELVFIGYGITAPEENYDDYAGIDVSGKILVMIRREPQHSRADGTFRGTETTQHSYIDTKLQLATNHGAAAVIFVNDLSTAASPDRDELTPPAGFGGAEAGIPFIHVRQLVVDRLLQIQPLKTGDGQQLSRFADVARHIDSTMTPISQSMDGWSADIQTEFKVDSVTTNNLIGVVEGEGPLSDETIVIGAHYDHLGFGGFGSRAAHRTGEVHNGADDNATGTAAVLELARRITAGPKPKRRMMFICFSGEERGLLGSRHYVQHPAVPLEETVAMLNFDMIGNLRNNQIEVNGVGSSPQFRAIVQSADQASPLNVRSVDSAFAGSDHLPFFQKGVPVLFCFTGLTDLYHTPDDDFNTINVDGVVRVIDYSEHLLRGIDALPVAPTFLDGKGRPRRRTRNIPVLGIRPDFSGDLDGQGVLVEFVSKDTGAEQAGVQVGDLIVGLNDTEIDSFPALTDFLKTSRAGDTIQVRVRRGQETLTIPVVLGAP
ncbi:MAG: M20/M25/M40 family metallo-hydrolase [Planctomycetaceae bacterium]